MPESFVSQFEKTDLALSNALSGDLRAAGQSLYNPDALSPHQRRTLAEKYLGAEPGPMGVILKTTTNPLIILGAVMTAYYPIIERRTKDGTLIGTGPDAMMSFDYLKKPLRGFIPFVDDIAGPDDLYQGTPIPDLIHELSRRTHEIKRTGTEMLGKAFAKYHNTMGGPIDKEAWNRIVTVMDDTRNPQARMWNALREAYADSPDELNKVNRLLAEGGRNRPFLQTLNPAEKTLVKDLGDYFDYHWGKSGTDQPGMEEALKRRTASKRFVGPNIPGEKLEQYWPRQIARTPEAAKQAIEEMSEAIVGGGKQEYLLKIYGNSKVAMRPSEFLQMQRYLFGEYGHLTAKEFEAATKEYLKVFHKTKSAAGPEKVASLQKLARFHRAVPDSRFLRELGGPYTELADLVDNARYIPAGGGGVAKELPQYRLGINVLRSYGHQSARDYGWSIHPKGRTESIGTRIMTVMREMGDGVKLPDGTLMKYPLHKAFMKDTLIPGILMDSQYEDFLASARWSSLRTKAAGFLESKTAKSWIPKALRESILESVEHAPPMGGRGPAIKLAGYFYTNTLGMPNFIAPLKNLGQNFLTTYPTIGARYTIHGMRETYARFQQYAALRYGKGVNAQDAWNVAFKAFKETDLDLDEGLRYLLRDLDNTYERAMRIPGELKGKVARIQKLLMAPFSATERANRLVAFYGSRQLYLDYFKGKEVPDELGGGLMRLEKSVSRHALENWTETGNKLAAYVNRKALLATSKMHFGGGIMNTPKFMAKWPTLFKQLMTFPMRFASFALRASLGTKGRILLASGLGVAVASLLLGDEGERLAQEGTLFGAFPLPTEHGPFAPWPLVPPALQIMGAGAEALMGDTTQLGRSAGLVIPGGVGMARMLGTHNKTAGNIFGRPYADYKNKTPDGRIPMYRPHGGGLIGYYSPTQLWAKSLGLGITNGGQEKALTRWMLGHREQLVALRRQYMEALSNNDQRAADKINARYAKMYPGMGDLPVKKSHIRALHLRRDVSRMERVLETMPPEIRNQFSAAASMAMAQKGPGFLGLQPGGLTAGSTIGSRDRYRTQPPVPMFGGVPTDTAAENRLSRLGGSFRAASGY